MKTTNRWKTLMVICGLVFAGTSSAQSSLKGVAVPTPPNLSTYVTNVAAAKVLGKALFWDMGVGNDNKQACASCHFHAGADNRAKNQLAPALDDGNIFVMPVFNPTKSGNAGGPNYTVKKSDFPFHVLSNPLDRNSGIVFDTDDILSSQGIFHFTGNTGIVSPPPIPGFDGNCSGLRDTHPFKIATANAIGKIYTRRVEPRNSPTTINAIFNFRNFWDGRANNRFNGSSPFGDRDTAAGIYVVNASNLLDKIKVSIPNASAASQAVGPPASEFEMACGNRGWIEHIARKLLGSNLATRKALAGQAVSSTDSLLATYRDASGIGLNKTYPELIRLAFSNAYWRGGEPSLPGAQLNINGVNYTQMEANFSLFFGLAVQLYESTLVSDDAPIDRYFASPGLAADPTKLTQTEKDGLTVFLGKGKCVACHDGPQLTGAGTPNYQDAQQGKLISRMIMGDGGVAHYDEGFYNIGVRPTFEDVGVGAVLGGYPLSFTRQLKNSLGMPFLLGSPSAPFVDPFTVDSCKFAVLLNGTPNNTSPPVCQPSVLTGFRTAVDGAFKTPTLRNVELTGPYFHNGSRKTLEEVVEFYNRGGDRRGPSGNDTTGFQNSGSLVQEYNLSNLDADITPLNLNTYEQTSLVAFLKRPLTDDRVRCDKAPFDHPELRIPNGHLGDNVAVTPIGGGPFGMLNYIAADSMLTVPAVGSAGMCGANLSGARLPFDQTLAP